MLESFFSPRSVAVIGASRDEAAVGRSVLRNLIDGGFPGEIYPVNPRAHEIEGRRCYASVQDLQAVPDLAVIVVPAPHVEPVLRQSGERGIGAAIVISAGFKESGPAGAALERSVVRAAHELGVRIIGPNCLGVIVPGARLNASFAGFMPPEGGVAFVSQSGALGTAMLEWAVSEHLGLSHFVSLGNKADVVEADLFAAWAEDPRVQVVAAYIEAVSDGNGFIEAARLIAERKPLVVLKSGLSDAGARAVSSHTGSLAGSRHVYDAAFRKAGVIQARTIEEFFDLAAAFARQPLPSRRGTCIVTNAGGPGILATDAAEQHGLTLSRLSEKTVKTLSTALPAAASVYNPVDVLGDASADRFAAAVSAVAKDPGVGSVLAVLTPQAMTDAVAVASAIAGAARGSGVTVLASFMGGSRVADGVEALRASGIPNYPFPERAVAVLSAMEQQFELRITGREPPPVDADRSVVRAAIDHASASGRTFITETSASRVAQAYGIAVPDGGVAADLAQARAIVQRIGYPVVVKIASPDILHKSDIGGIMVGVQDDESLVRSYERVLSNARARLPEARIWGVTLQKQVSEGVETIIGVVRDPAFGHVLMFGLGGIYVEVLEDVAFTLCPVSHTEAHDMVGRIRAFPLLRGARGRAPADVDALVDVIVRVSALVTEFPEIHELDINPLIVLPKGHGAVAADIRIGIGG